MEISFAAIGLEVTGEKAFNLLAERAGANGEATILARRNGVLHGRCWKIGEGLEVWTMLYESAKGDVFYADCRPSFRARYLQTVSPWALTEYDEDGEAVIHGYCEGSEKEVLFELQNLTEIGFRGFRGNALRVGLCGLAYRAEVADKKNHTIWQPLEKSLAGATKNENDWHLSGTILDFRTFQNPLSGENLFWIYVDLNGLKLEVLINRKHLKGENPHAGANLTADIWLQGHIVAEAAYYSRFEGVDPRTETAAFWQHLRRRN
jgi:hypothetical protein